MTREEIGSIVERQRAFFRTGATLPVERRLGALPWLQRAGGGPRATHPPGGPPILLAQKIPPDGRTACRNSLSPRQISPV